MIEALLLILGVVLLVIVLPFIQFAWGWCVGHLIKWIFGATFVTGLAMLGIHISPESIPLFCGTVSVIASFFKTTSTNKQKDEKKIDFKHIF